MHGTSGSVIFDGAVKAAPGMDVEFTRDSPTLDYAGAPVAANVPRWGRRAGYAASGFTPAAHPDWTGGQATVLGYGVAADGVTPLSIHHWTTEGKIVVHRGTDFTRVRERFVVKAGGGQDFAAGLPIEEPNILNFPRTGCICHGLIVVLCERQHDIDAGAGRSWQVQGVSLFYSADEGATWAWVPYAGGGLYPPGEAATYGTPRGNRWALQNYFPEEYGQQPLLGAWFAPTDYLESSGKIGGQQLLFRARRASPADAWTVEPAVLVDSHATPGWNTHYHSGAVITRPGRVEVITLIGDNHTDNGWHRFICNDPENYTSAAWTVDRYYGGRIPRWEGSAILKRNNQDAGVAPGPLPGTFLATGDQQTGAIHLVTVPEEGPPEVRRLWGAETSNMSSSQRAYDSLSLHTPTPERGGPYVARWTSGTGFSGSIADEHRTLISEDGLHWSDVRTYNAAPNGFFYGRDIVVGSAEYWPRLPVYAYRPLSIGPGGTNRHNAAWATSKIAGGASTTITLCPRDGQGRWLHPDTGAILPQPPSYGPVYVVSLHRQEAFVELGYQQALPHAHPVGPFSARAYIMTLEGTGMEAIFSAGTATAGALRKDIVVDADATDWLPVVHFGTLTGNSLNPYNPWWKLSGSAQSWERFLWCPSEWIMAATAYPPALPGYPLPLGAVDAPPERVRISGLAAHGRWTLAVALRLPADTWDFYVDPVPVPRVPLFTAWAAEDTHIYVSYNPATRATEAAITVGGALIDTLSAPDTSYLRDGIANIVLVHDRNGPAHGQPVVALDVHAGGPAAAPKQDTTALAGAALGETPALEVRFGNPDFTAVGAFDLYAVHFNAEDALHATAERNALRAGTMFAPPEEPPAPTARRRRRLRYVFGAGPDPEVFVR